MAKMERDAELEERITMEIVVDAYRPEEQAMGWYYLQDTMQFPFTATCISKRRSSPVKEGETAPVVGMTPEDECEREMFVEIDSRWRYAGGAIDSVGGSRGRCRDTANAHRLALLGQSEL